MLRGLRVAEGAARAYGDTRRAFVVEPLLQLLHVALLGVDATEAVQAELDAVKADVAHLAEIVGQRALVGERPRPRLPRMGSMCCVGMRMRFSLWRLLPISE